jgi:fatty acid desaturase
VEWPTVILAASVYGGWIAVLALHRTLPWPVAAVLLGLTVTWQTSLQHEVIHGHPLRVRRLNDALGAAPLSLWLPYGRYRTLHLRHHRDEHLTDPVEDPETFYVSAERWDAMGPAMQALVFANRTFVGRLVIGPFLGTVGLWASEARAAVRGDRNVLRSWAWHPVGVAGVLLVAVGVFGVPLWLYLFGGFLLARSFGLVRSFCEHRWVPGDASRSAVVRAGRFWSLLFLNNNLHHAHHARAGVAWYRLPALADALASDDAAMTGAGWYGGYGDVARRYALRPFCQPVHPGAMAEDRP